MNIKKIVGVVIAKDGKILAVRRAEMFMKGRIDIPAGNLETGESLETAAAREVLEETGYKVEIGHSIGDVDIPIGDTVYRNHLFSAKIVSGNPVPQPGEVDEILWVEPQVLLTSALEHGLPESVVKPLVNRIIQALNLPAPAPHQRIKPINKHF